MDSEDLICQINALVCGCGYAYYKGYIIEQVHGELLVYPSSGVAQTSLVKHPHQNIVEAIKYIDTSPQ
jgi:hypothetical protein